MSVTSNVNGIYEYNGSLADIGLGGLLDTSLLNVGSGALSGTFVDNNGQLSQADDGLTTFALTGGAPVAIDYIGSGTISTLSFLGIPLDPRPVAVFVVNGQIYFYAPQGMPLLSGLTFSLNISASATFNLPAASNGAVDGLDGAENMSVGYTDLQGDRITNEADQIFGYAGNDTIAAGGGHDTVFGGIGNDRLSGEAGDDLLYGDAGNDTLFGGDGQDTLFGGAGFDDLYGGVGNDRLESGDGGGRLYGGDGNDTLIGGSGSETLDGGAGDDNLVSGGGADLLIGGTGNDTITVSGFGAVQVQAGDDRDVILLQDGLLSGGSVIDGGEGGDDFDILDLRDAGPRKVVFDADNPENGTIFWLDANGELTGQTTSFFNIEKVICFATGTRITTYRGKRPVEDLKVGDLVLTFDNGFRPIRWIGSRMLSARELRNNDLLRPITIRAGALGHGLPERDLVLSRQHRVLVKSPVAERMFGQREVLVPAKDLRGLDGVDIASDIQSVEYWHILFDDHEVILSENTPTESFFFGAQARGTVSSEAYEEIISIFPDMDLSNRQLARQEARGNRARHFVKRVTANGKLVLESETEDLVAGRGPPIHPDVLPLAL